jgi:hypothetical protein
LETSAEQAHASDNGDREVQNMHVREYKLSRVLPENFLRKEKEDTSFEGKVKVELSRYRPEQAHGDPVG